jgi:hypothetical protein
LALALESLSRSRSCFAERHFNDWSTNSGWEGCLVAVESEPEGDGVDALSAEDVGNQLIERLNGLP